MSDIVRKLRASLGMDAINGDAFERGVCGRQMKEAADEIDRLRARNAKLGRERDRLRNALEEIEGIDPRDASTECEVIARQALAARPTPPGDR